MKKKTVLKAFAIAGALASIAGCAPHYDQQEQSSHTPNQPWFVQGDPLHQQR